MVGNGSALMVEGLIKRLDVDIQNHRIQLPAYLLPISLKFMLNDKFVTLRREQTKLPAQAQFNHLRRMFHTKAIAEMYCLQFQTQSTAEDKFLDLPVNTEPEIALLLHTYREIFDEPKGLPPPRSHTHAIPLLQGSNLVKVRPYHYPFSQKQQIQTMVHEMLQTGIIVPSNSPFSSPIILVKKKDGTWRFCTDYKALNAITVKDSFPIPTVDELIDELHRAQFFSKLDLRAGYHQILVQEEDRYKTAFRTYQGLYEWRVMPFGLTNAPTTFQSLMNNIFQNLLRKYVLVFFDDILVYSPTWCTHLTHLEHVLRLLQEHKLFAKLSKCIFAKQQVEYLGHTVSAAGIAMEEGKIQAVWSWPLPKSLKQLLGLTGYYRRLSRIMQP